MNISDPRNTGNLSLNHDDDLSRFGTQKNKSGRFDATPLSSITVSPQRSQNPGSEICINDEQVDDACQKDLAMIEPRTLNPNGENLELGKVEKLPTFRNQ
jgi:hypothetical protein